MKGISRKSQESESFVDEHSSIPDRFNEIFSELGWVYYRSFDSEVALNAINRAEYNDLSGAEIELVEYYKSNLIEYNLQELDKLKAFRPRSPLAKKALIDYNDKRYHASVPVVLALIDGMITDAYLDAGGSQINISAGELNDNAWNSVENHSRALKTLVGILKKQRFKTVIDRIDKPYRNGILHGMDLGYDNKVVAAKTWSALFAFSDWVESAEKGLLNIQFDKIISNFSTMSNCSKGFGTRKGHLIRDIPSIKKIHQDLTQLELIKSVMPILHPLLSPIGVETKRIEEALSQIEQLKVGSEMLYVPDRFNDLFGECGWIFYEYMNYQVAVAAIQKAESGDLRGAESDLANYYDEETIRFKIKRMKDVEAFRPRWDLTRKALEDYVKGRYYACVPVVLAMLDGIVNEVHLKGRGSRLGFSAENVDLEAWDSISGHFKGLKLVAKVLNEDRNKTNVNQIDRPYRNGILHGMDLSYDNKIVAAKAWGALFSIRDWAMKAEHGSLDPHSPEKPITWSLILKQIIDNEAEKKKLKDWKPRVIKLGEDIPSSGDPNDYNEGTPEWTLAKFLSSWKKSKPDYRSMAECVLLNSGDNKKAIPARIRDIYDSKHLQSFDLIEIKDTAESRTVIKANLIYEEFKNFIEKRVEFIMIKRCDNDAGGIECGWFILFWDIA